MLSRQMSGRGPGYAGRNGNHMQGGSRTMNGGMKGSAASAWWRNARRVTDQTAQCQAGERAVAECLVVLAAHIVGWLAAAVVPLAA